MGLPDLAPSASASQSSHCICISCRENIMNVTIIVSAALRRHVDNLERLTVDSSGDVASALTALAVRYPKIGGQLFSPSGKLRGFIMVFVNASNIKQLQNQQTALNEGDQIRLLPAFAGG
jgi:molybdopterin synthase sulfur carrier subunit